jgi:hypothetical protein
VQIAHPWHDDPESIRKPATRPYEAVEFDGHKIDVRLTLRIDDPFGFETLLVLHRIWILLLLDVATRAVIGYALALGLRARGKRWTSGGTLKILKSAVCRVSIRLGTGCGFFEVIEFVCDPRRYWICDRRRRIG